MSAQATERSLTAATKSSYGALAQGSGLPSGVTSTQQPSGSASGTVEQVALGNPSIYDPAPQAEQDPASGTITSTELRSDVAEPPYGGPDRCANVISPMANGVLTTPTRTDARVDVRMTPEPPATMRVQEFFSAESTVSAHEERNIRWMTRFTELTRAAATRGASSWDRVMDNLGMQPGPAATSNSGLSLFSGRTREVHMNFSPPEELPQSSTRAMQPPTSWTTATTQQPLFNQTQVAQLRQAQREHPLLYGQPSEVGSDHSSRLQAEVQRQMEEYNMKYQEEQRGPDPTVHVGERGTSSTTKATTYSPSKATKGGSRLVSLHNGLEVQRAQILWLFWPEESPSFKQRC